MPSTLTHLAQHYARRRFVWIFGILLSFFVLMPVAHQLRLIDHGALPWLLDFLERLLFVGLLGSVATSVSSHRAAKLLTLSLAGVGIALWMLPTSAVTDAVDLVRHVCVIVFLAIAVVAMIRVIMEARRVTTDVVCASLCIYLLLGVTWGVGYSAVAILDAGAFSSTLLDHKELIYRLGFGNPNVILYFSFTTLTTLGYGDVVPTSPVARGLSSLEAVVGQLYLAVMVARLVALHVTDAQTMPKDAPDQSLKP